MQIPVRKRGDDAGNRRRQRGKGQRHAVEQELDGDAALVRRRPVPVRHQHFAGTGREIEEQGGHDRGE